MKVHYLEIVTHDVDAVCNSYKAAQSIGFGEPDKLLGGARTCVLPDNSIVGVRSPLRDSEQPVVRPYWLVENIEVSLQQIESNGGQVAVPPMEILGKGIFAIYILGGNDHGLWQLETKNS